MLRRAAGSAGLAVCSGARAIAGSAVFAAGSERLRLGLAGEGDASARRRLGLTHARGSASASAAGRRGWRQPPRRRPGSRQRATRCAPAPSVSPPSCGAVAARFAQRRRRLDLRLDPGQATRFGVASATSGAATVRSRRRKGQPAFAEQRHRRRRSGERSEPDDPGPRTGRAFGGGGLAAAQPSTSLGSSVITLRVDGARRARRQGDRHRDPGDRRRRVVVRGKAALAEPPAPLQRIGERRIAQLAVGQGDQLGMRAHRRQVGVVGLEQAAHQRPRLRPARRVQPQASACSGSGR